MEDLKDLHDKEHPITETSQVARVCIKYDPECTKDEI